MSIPAYLKYIGLTVLFVVAAVNFTRTTLSVIESSRRLEELRGDVSDLEAQKSDLEEEVEYRETADFIEKEAREKLGLVMTGEELFVTEDVLGEKTHEELASSRDSGFKTVPAAWIDLFGLF